MNLAEVSAPSSQLKDGALYLDNAATSWPKPPEVAHAMVAFLEEVGSNPGRSGHRASVEAARIVYAARECVTELFNAPDPMRVVFDLNVTAALNLVFRGLLTPGDHVITSSMEHNSVMRPLRLVEQHGVELTCVPCGSDGTLEVGRVEAAVRANTRLIAINHASNVCGTLLPVSQVGQVARRHNLLFLVDSAQTAGAFPIDIESDCIDLLAFTGHKSLYGPTGTGGLVLGSRVDPAGLSPLKCGGTGSRSEHEQQPDFLPDRYESGTPNIVGLAGLRAGIEWVLRQGVETLRQKETCLCAQLLEGLAELPDITVYGTGQADRQTAVVAFNVKGVEPSEIGLHLDEDYDILCRVGLHCAPAAHRTLGTFSRGAVRFSLGAFNTRQDVASALAAISQLCQKEARR